MTDVEEILRWIHARVRASFTSVEEAFQYFDTENQGAIPYSLLCDGLNEIGVEIDDFSLSAAISHALRGRVTSSVLPFEDFYVLCTSAKSKSALETHERFDESVQNTFGKGAETAKLEWEAGEKCDDSLLNRNGMGEGDAHASDKKSGSSLRETSSPSKMYNRKTLRQGDSTNKSIKSFHLSRQTPDLARRTSLVRGNGGDSNSADALWNGCMSAISLGLEREGIGGVRSASSGTVRPEQASFVSGTPLESTVDILQEVYLSPHAKKAGASLAKDATSRRPYSPAREAKQARCSDFESVAEKFKSRADRINRLVFKTSKGSNQTRGPVPSVISESTHFKDMSPTRKHESSLSPALNNTNTDTPTQNFNTLEKNAVHTPSRREPVPVESPSFQNTSSMISTLGSQSMNRKQKVSPSAGRMPPKSPAIAALVEEFHSGEGSSRSGVPKSIHDLDLEMELTDFMSKEKGSFGHGPREATKEVQKWLHERTKRVPISLPQPRTPPPLAVQETGAIEEGEDGTVSVQQEFLDRALTDPERRSTLVGDVKQMIKAEKKRYESRVNGLMRLLFSLEANDSEEH